MANTTIYLIRHGEIDNPQNIIYGRVVDLSLNETGYKQMERLGNWFKNKGVKPNIIYTSPLRRTIQSAEGLSEIFSNIPIKKDEDLQEVSVPGLEKYTIDWLASIGGDVYAYQGKEMKDVSIEQPAVQAERIVRTIRRVIHRHFGKTIVLISHGDPLIFGLWKLLYPHKPFPQYHSLKRKGLYLQKGEAWRLVFDEHENLIKHQLMSPKDVQ